MELTPEQQKAIQEQKEHCPFCQIIAGKIPAQKVYEDERIIAVLDINPASKGHVLVMPKEHYPIMPLIPPEEFEYLFSRVREISHYVREAVVASHAQVFIANGQAAGQQSTHFLVHIIPDDGLPENFRLPSNAHDDERMQEVGRMLSHNLPIMLRERSPKYPIGSGASPADGSAAPQGAVSDLAVAIEENPELRDAIKSNPDAVIAGINENPSLKPMFEGVDVHALSAKLNAIDEGAPDVTRDAPSPGPVERPSPAPEPASPVEPSPAPAPEQDTEQVPVAMDMNDAELRIFIDGNEKLKKYLLEDLETLKQAIPSQPRLKAFFAGTSPEAVAARYAAGEETADIEPAERQSPTGRRFGGDL